MPVKFAIRYGTAETGRAGRLLPVACAALAGACLLVGCAHQRFPVIHPVSKPTREDLALSRAQEYFIKGRDYDRRELHQMAQHFYELAFELDPKSDILRGLLAQKYVQSGKYAQALILIKDNRKYEELSVDERRLVATLYMKMGQFDQAVEVLEQMPELSAEEKYSLGFLYESMGKLAKAIACYARYFETEQGHSLETGLKIAQMYSRLARYTEAESVYVTLESEFGGNQAEIFNGLGLVSLLRGDTAKALDFLKTAVMVDSNYYDAMRVIAQVAIQRNDFEEAIRYHEKLYHSEDLLNEAYGRTLALLYYYNKQFAQAEALLKALIAEDIEDYGLHFYLGLVFSAQENEDLAEMEFEKSVTLEPGFADGWQHLCYLELRRKKPDKALEFAKRFVKRVPESSSSWRTLGYVHSSRSDFAQAITALQKAVGLDSIDAMAWFDLGAAYERTGEYGRAASSFRTVLKLSPDDHTAANYLGYMWAEQGIHLDSAKALLEFALERDPDNGAYLDSYAWIFYKKKNLKEAREQIDRAIAVIDNDPVIFEHLGDILTALGDPGGAIEAYRKSIALDSEHKDKLEDTIQRLEEKMRIPVSQELKPQ